MTSGEEAPPRDDFSISFVEYYVLVMLSEQADRTLRLTKLTVLVNAELSRISHLVGRLERRGLVRREADPTDGRCTNAILTDAGLTHLQAAAPDHVRTVRRLVFDVLTRDSHFRRSRCTPKHDNTIR